MLLVVSKILSGGSVLFARLRVRLQVFHKQLNTLLKVRYFQLLPPTYFFDKCNEVSNKAVYLQYEG